MFIMYLPISISIRVILHYMLIHAGCLSLLLLLEITMMSCGAAARDHDDEHGELRSCYCWW
jgi:hypothetical protein